jgi:hypothetical protein
MVAIGRSTSHITVTDSPAQCILHCSAISAAAGGSMNIRGVKRSLNFYVFPNRRGEEKQ